MTEKRLIDANKVAQDVRENNKDNFFRVDWSSKRVCELLESAPTVDAVEVVRCRDCRHAYINSFAVKQEKALCNRCFDHDGNAVLMQADDFCSYGERRTDA